MLRVARSILLCVLVGLVFSVLLAWTGAFLFSIGGMNKSDPTPTRWASDVPGSWPAAPTSESQLRTWLWTMQAQQVNVDPGDDTSGISRHLLTRHMYGVPFRSLVATEHTTVRADKSEESEPASTIERGIRLGSRSYHANNLALMPIPRGFALNWAIFAGVALLLRVYWAGLKRLRKRIDKRRVSDPSAALSGPPR